MLLSQRLKDELDRLAKLQFSFDMDNSDCPSPPSPPPASRSQSNTRRSTDRGSSSATSASTAVASTNPPAQTPSTNFPPLDPFSLMNNQRPRAGSHTARSPVQVSGSNTPVHMSDNRPFAGLPGTMPPQYHPHLAMWPFMPQQPVAFNPLLPTSHTPGIVNTRLQEGYPFPSFAAGPSGSHHASPPMASTSQATSPATPHPGQTVNGPEDAAILEDKRRRNTAASARFRIKKKQKTLNLERTVSDLSSRAEELEREAANLRRENTWLKEMVIMKGRGSKASQRPSSSESEGGHGRQEDSSSEDSSDRDKQKKGGDKGKGKAKRGKS